MLLELIKIKRTYRNVNRIRTILNVFIKHGFGQLIEQLNLHRILPFRKRIKVLSTKPVLEKSIAERLRRSFEELGPSFIKLAQILSSRPDLITASVAEEFKKLQDEVPPFPYEQVRELVIEELGRPPEEVFVKFHEKPVAAASIAQVHEAVLADEGAVMVKIQRPNIRNIIETDILIMSIIAGLMVKYLPETEFFNPEGIVEEFTRTIRKELDFNEEVKNMGRFRRNFEAEKDIIIPKTFPEFTTDRIIVMEKIEGVSIDDTEEIEKLGLDRTEIAEKGIKAYFKMMLDDGFFHADPHPGNIFVTPEGSIGLVDFGIVGWLTTELMENIAGALIALVKKDFDELIVQYVQMGLFTDDVNIESLKQELKTDLIDLMAPLYDMSISEINIAQYLDALTHLAIRHKLKIPSDLLLVNKTMLILDNIGRLLDPEFNFVTFSEPYASKLVRRKYSPQKMAQKIQRHATELTDFLVTTPRNIRMLLRKALKNDLHVNLSVKELDRLTRDIDKSTNRLSFSVVIASIILSSAILTQSDIGGRVFGVPMFGVLGFSFAFFMGIWLIISIIRSGRL
ncbi:MAG: AarF/ABC1/UbiB kinase family protein [Nitrospirota bacterium]|nr:MAG: AarF/ABC1/UbiB kinase family protein [Nitrospirota bacterium]